MSQLYVVCGGNIDVQSRGTFHSPNFPNKFPMDMQCAWVLTTSQSNNVILEFNDFEVCTSQNDAFL